MQMDYDIWKIWIAKMCVLYLKFILLEEKKMKIDTCE